MFRAIKDYTGSDTSTCISLRTGDELSAVHSVDDNWFVGYNKRTGETGAFPVTCVEAETGSVTYHIPAKRGNVSQSPKKLASEYASKPLQSLMVDNNETSKTKRMLSDKTNTVDANQLQFTKTEKTFKIETPENDSDGGNKRKFKTNDSMESERRLEMPRADVLPIHYVETKVNALHSVRFHDLKAEQSSSAPESVVSCQDSLFSQSNASHHRDSQDTITEEPTRVKAKDDGNYFKLKTDRILALKGNTDKLFHSGKDENTALKTVFGSLTGLVIGGVLFILLKYSFGYESLVAGIIVAVVTIIISICLALSTVCRCIMALVLPNFFTGKGRTVCLSIIFGIMILTPITNITDNAKKTGNSMGCIFELAANQTRDLQKQLALPIITVEEYISNQTEKLRDVSNRIEDSFAPIRKSFDTTAAEEFQKMRKKCKELPEVFVKECKDVLCSTTIRDLLSRDLCDKCEEIRKNFEASVCDQLKDVDNFIIRATKKTRSAVDEADKYFVVDIKVEGGLSGNASTSKPVSAIKDRVNEDISEKANAISGFLSVAKKLLSLSLALLFLKSFWYLRNYLSKDGYDNIYITKQFKKLDSEAGKKDLEPILPLKKKERDSYVETSSWTLNASELAYCKLGLIQVMLHFLLCFSVIVFEFSLYYILNIIKQYGKNLELGIESQSRFKINVQGNGPIADFYRIALGDFNIDQNYTASFKIDKCLPNATEPSVAVIPVVLFLYFLTLVCVLLRGYGMRLRRKISAYYYPEQETARLEYLHKKIRHKRVGFLKFMRQHIKSSHKESTLKVKLSLSTWLAFKFPFLASCLPDRSNLECSSCEHKESSFHHVRLTKCTGEIRGIPCEAVYCQECSAALHNVCPLCSEEEVTRRE